MKLTLDDVIKFRKQMEENINCDYQMVYNVAQLKELFPNDLDIMNIENKEIIGKDIRNAIDNYLGNKK